MVWGRVSVFLEHETGPPGVSRTYKGLRGPARFLEMRLGRKCALNGDWVCAETVSAGVPAGWPKACIYRGELPDASRRQSTHQGTGLHSGYTVSSSGSSDRERGAIGGGGRADADAG